MFTPILIPYKTRVASEIMLIQRVKMFKFSSLLGFYVLTKTLEKWQKKYTP